MHVQGLGGAAFRLQNRVTRPPCYSCLALFRLLKNGAPSVVLHALCYEPLAHRYNSCIRRSGEQPPHLHSLGTTESDGCRRRQRGGRHEGRSSTCEQTELSRSATKIRFPTVWGQTMCLPHYPAAQTRKSTDKWVWSGFGGLWMDTPRENQGTVAQQRGLEMVSPGLDMVSPAL